MSNFKYETLDMSFFDGQVTTLETKLDPNIPYYLGYDIKEKFCDKLKESDFDKVIFITEKAIYDYHGQHLYATFSDHSIESELLFIEGGEGDKSYNFLSELTNKLIDLGVTKDTILLAFGGGSVGNIVGLSAALIFRGIRFIEMPTTFMGQTDSTLSHKQAINGQYGKNHFGHYYAPLFIWSDILYISTEPKRSLRSGIVESVKNGFIYHPHFLDVLENKLKPNVDFSKETLCNLVYYSILSKIEIIECDPTERKLGMILEYGHTFGHALEWLGKGKYLHGEAVAIGMVIAAQLSEKLGHLTPSDVKRHEEIFQDKLGLDLSVPDAIDPDEIHSTIVNDNKRGAGGVQYILLEKIGSCKKNGNDSYMVDIPNELVKSNLDSYLASNSC